MRGNSVSDAYPTPERHQCVLAEFTEEIYSLYVLYCVIIMETKRIFLPNQLQRRHLGFANASPRAAL
jgi:hypothetical protein